MRYNNNKPVGLIADQSCVGRRTVASCNPAAVGPYLRMLHKKTGLAVPFSYRPTCRRMPCCIQQGMRHCYTVTV